MADRGITSLANFKQNLVSYATTGSFAGDKSPYPSYGTFLAFGRTGAEHGVTTFGRMGDAFSTTKQTTINISIAASLPSFAGNIVRTETKGYLQPITSAVHNLPMAERKTTEVDIINSRYEPAAAYSASEHKTVGTISFLYSAISFMTNFETVRYLSQPTYILSVGGISTSVSTTYTGAITYYMRAYHNVLLQYVLWSVADVPDTTGIYSGYTPSDLRDIVVLRKYNYS